MKIFEHASLDSITETSYTHDYTSRLRPWIVKL